DDRDSRARSRGASAPGLPALLAPDRPVLGAHPAPLAASRAGVRPLVIAVLALLLVTAVWGVTFVQVKDAVEIYPLFAFLAIRFAIASITLTPFAARRMRTLDRRGLVAGFGLGGLLALGYTLQTAGLARTTVSGTGFITGLC